MTDAPDPSPPEDVETSSPSLRTLAQVVFVLALVLACAGVFVGELQVDLRDSDDLGHSPVLATAIYLFALALLLAIANARRAEDRPVEDPGRPLCTHCLTPHVHGVHFCPTCAKPLTVFAATAYYERIYAWMWALGKAAHHPSRGLHVAGVVLIAGSSLLGVVIFLAYAYYIPYQGMCMSNEQGLVTIFGGVLFLGMIVVYVALLLLCIRNWRRFRPDPEGPPLETDYGAPPWWTYDGEWRLPEPEEPTANDADS